MSLTLEYPPTNISHTVILRSPEYGNTINVDTHKVYRRLMGGTIVSVKDSSWPTQKIYSYKFIALTMAERDAFKSFLGISAGKLLKVTDHHGDERTGVIITPVVEIVTSRDHIIEGGDAECDDGDAHQYDAGFEFLVDEEDETRVEAVYEDDDEILFEDSVALFYEDA